MKSQLSRRIPGCVASRSNKKFGRVALLLLLTMAVVVMPTLALVTVPATALADDAKWDVEGELGPAREINFTTDEGTWMNLDVSPDGKEIVFDLLGDIYIMPIAGGKATPLATGSAFDVQPRFSPDGAYISYTSDAGGGDNIWYMRRDGSDKKQITKEDFRLLNNACWVPGGEYIVARKHFTSARSLGAGEMWIYHISGGKGLQLTKRTNDQKDAGEPCVSQDGRYVYFSEDLTPGSRFQYNKDPYGQIYVIRRYDRESGEIDNVVTGPGGAARPTISPDGNTLAFVRRVRLETVLFVQNLETGEQFPIFDGLSKDQQETWAIFGVYPNFAWAPDGKSIVFWAKGKIWSVAVGSREVTSIPFEVDANHVVYEPLRFRQDVSPAQFESKMIRHGVTSPDGKTLVFSAIGHLWKKKLPDGTPERLTKDGDRWEMWPSFSPDGKWIVYTTWNDEERGTIRRVKSNGKSGKVLTLRPGIYVAPTYSPDGKHIVYSRVAGDEVLGFTYGVDPGIYWMTADGGEGQRIRKSGRSPRFSHDGKRVFFVEGGSGDKKNFKSVRFADGGDERTHVTSMYANQFVPSPDGKWLAFAELFNGYIVPFPETGRSYDLSSKMTEVPVNRVTRDAGTYMHWSGDSRKLHWTIGGEYYTRDLGHSFMFVENAADTVAPVDTTGVAIGLVLDTDVPEGRIALVGGRIITMAGDDVIENGTVLVERNRIVAVGASSDVDVPSDYTTIDCAGKTLMPGLVDVHAHMWHSFTGISPTQSWMYLANLAFGVTTTHDPSNPTEMVFTHSEMVRAGELVGPRVYSTGTILYGADGDFKAVVNELDDARSHLRRMKAVGAFSVKSYNQPRREQRQQVITAARELHMMVMPEGGSFFYHNMSMILDGHTGIEHTIPIAPVYNDVITLWSRSGVGSTPTLVVGYGGIWGENYWYQKTNVWENERLLAFTPRPVVDERSRRRIMIPDDDFNHVTLAGTCKQLVDAGGRVQLGAHGQLQGLGSHWEMWMFEQGGMTPMEALRCATLYGAEYIGMDHDIGSIDKGKLADIVVLNKNPLDNLRDSEDILYTMVNGRIYDAMTMREIGNYENDRVSFYWEFEGANDGFVWRGPAQGFQRHQCGCVGAH